MLTLDTSGIVGAADTQDRAHAAVIEALSSEKGPLIIPAEILSETAYMLERRVGVAALRAFIVGLGGGEPAVDHGSDFVRIGSLMSKYADLELGFADAAVVACAERNGGRVLTTDRRDFDVVARGEGTITVVP